MEKFNTQVFYFTLLLHLHIQAIILVDFLLTLYLDKYILIWIYGHMFGIAWL